MRVAFLETEQLLRNVLKQELPMSVGRICTREVDLAQMDESVWQAAERMHQRAVGTLVVIDDDKKPIGIVTDRDLVERVLAKFLDPGATTVGLAFRESPEAAGWCSCALPRACLIARPRPAGRALTH